MAVAATPLAGGARRTKRKETKHMHRLAALSVLFFPAIAQAHGVHPHLREDTFGLAGIIALSVVLTGAVFWAGRKSAQLAPAPTKR